MAKANRMEIFDTPWFIQVCMPVAGGTMIEIRGMRFSHLAQRFEAREIYDSTSGTTYRNAYSPILYELPWQEVSLTAIVHHVTVSAVGTAFVLSPPAQTGDEDLPS
jgi:hypothetical protein